MKESMLEGFIMDFSMAMDSFIGKMVANIEETTPEE